MGFPPLNITEVDGAPSTFPYKMIFPNGSLTDNGDATTTVSFTPDLSAYIPFNASKGADLGDGVNPVLLNFNSVTNDGVLQWDGATGVFSLTRGTDTPFWYAGTTGSPSGYDPIISASIRGSTGVATGFWASTGTKLNMTEVFAFWGGVFDEGANAKGMSSGGFGAAGLFAYNAMQGTNTRTYPLLSGITAISETSGASNLTVTDLAGGIFQANDAAGTSCTYTRVYGVWIKDGFGGTTNYGLYINRIYGGTNDYAIVTNGGHIVFNEASDNDTDFRYESATEANMIFADGSADKLYLGGTTNGVTFDKGGNQSFLGAAGFYPRTLNQTAEPAAGTGATELDTSEMCIWTDSDDAKCYLCYNHGGTIKTVELT